MNSFVAALPLGIDFAEIGLHIFNFVILMVALWLLLYKPVKKFIKKRQAEYQAQEDANKKSAEDADALKQEYLDLMEKGREDAVKITEEAYLNTKLKEEEVLEDAKKTADALILEAQTDVKRIKKQAQEDVAQSVSALAVSLAAEILEREVSAIDNDRSINAIINEWKAEKEGADVGK